MTDSTPSFASGLAILICSPSTDEPALVVTPLVHALAASALDLQVEIHFAGPAVRWLVRGVAENAYPVIEANKSVLKFIQEAVAEGVCIKACSMARANWLQPTEMLIEECQGAVGATAFIARAIDPQWRTLVF